MDCFSRLRKPPRVVLTAGIAAPHVSHGPASLAPRGRGETTDALNRVGQERAGASTSSSTRKRPTVLTIFAVASVDQRIAGMPRRNGQALPDTGFVVEGKEAKTK